MPHRLHPLALHALVGSVAAVLPKLYAPRAQNDNDHPSSPASAAALRSPATTAGEPRGMDLLRRA